MSKQLSISATLAVLSMAFVALASTLANPGAGAEAHRAAAAPLIGFEASR